MTDNEIFARFTEIDSIKISELDSDALRWEKLTKKEDLREALQSELRSATDARILECLPVPGDLKKKL